MRFLEVLWNLNQYMRSKKDDQNRAIRWLHDDESETDLKKSCGECSAYFPRMEKNVSAR